MRHIVFPELRPLLGFNSRTREDATWGAESAVTGIPVSIHAPVRMRLALTNGSYGDFCVSIHAPVRMRLIMLIVLMAVKLFQFTHP